MKNSDKYLIAAMYKQASAYPHLEKQAGLLKGIQQGVRATRRAFGSKVAPLLDVADGATPTTMQRIGRGLVGGRSVDNFVGVGGTSPNAFHRRSLGAIEGLANKTPYNPAGRFATGNPGHARRARYSSNAKQYNNKILPAGVDMLKRPAMIAGGTLAAGGLAGGSHAMGQRSAIKKMQSSYENMSFIQKLMMAMKMMGGQGPAQLMKQYGR
jgi:hypothetical protein